MDASLGISLCTVLILGKYMNVLHIFKNELNKGQEEGTQTRANKTQHQTHLLLSLSSHPTSLTPPPNYLCPVRLEPRLCKPHVCFACCLWVGVTGHQPEPGLQGWRRKRGLLPSHFASGPRFPPWSSHSISPPPWKLQVLLLAAAKCSLQGDSFSNSLITTLQKQQLYPARTPSPSSGFQRSGPLPPQPQKPALR